MYKTVLPAQFTYGIIHTHSHNDSSRNWVLLLVEGGKYCEEMKVFSLALKDDGVEQCLRSCGSEFQMWGPKQEKVQKPYTLRLYCWIFKYACVRRRAQWMRRNVDL